MCAAAGVQALAACWCLGDCLVRVVGDPGRRSAEDELSSLNAALFKMRFEDTHDHGAVMFQPDRAAHFNGFAEQPVFLAFAKRNRLIAREVDGAETSKNIVCPVRRQAGKRDAERGC